MLNIVEDPYNIVDEASVSVSDTQNNVDNAESLRLKNSNFENSNLDFGAGNDGHPESADSFLLIAVMTARENFQKRADIRNTWAKGHRNVLFFVGSCDCEVPKQYRAEKWGCEKKKGVIIPDTDAQTKRVKLESVVAKLKNESDAHGDMIFLHMMESYRKLPQKLKLMYNWTLDNLSVKWILKVDDDMFVWVGKLDRYLRNTYKNSEMTILGTIARDWRVHRKGKWAETLYERPRYPKFAIGQSGHLVTRDVARRIVEYNGTDHQGEDVSIGIWIKEMEAQNKSLKFNLINSPVMTAEGDCSIKGGYYVIGHKMGYSNFVKCLN